MEGYSVTEAASVLGVPAERVWELLARGVLAGQPEGETGMRVFLQPRPAPAAAPAQSARTDSGNGEEHRELSPFRELLTEFRSLTERYGQALLALGEARGEVAALRSRVDLLEARMDLRLPSAATDGPPVGWAEPVPRTPPRPAPEAAPAPEPTGMVRPEPDRDDVPRTEAEPAPEVRTPRRSTAGHATDGFAEALARAEDPSVPELLGGAETAAAHANLGAESGGDVPDDADVTLPRELAPATDVPVAEEAAETVDGDGGAEKDTSTERKESDDDGAPEQDATEVAAVDATAGEQSEPEPEPDPEAAQAQGAQAQGAPAQAADAESEPESAEPDAMEAPAWRDDRYTAEIGDPDWWEPEDESSEPASAVEERPQPSPASPAIEPRGLTRLRRVPPARPEEATVPAEEAGEAADEMEMAPTGRSGAEDAPPDARPPSDDPLAALEALSRATPGPTSRPGPRPQPPARSPVSHPPAASARPLPPTAAGRAYRRLRRIFPG
ncbi:MAG: hypothetical protein KY392_01280 [Chloroflexi bacterium]|nr:hypothetical protein [Chloroflexota bacterium]